MASIIAAAAAAHRMPHLMMYSGATVARITGDRHSEFIAIAAVRSAGNRTSQSGLSLVQQLALMIMMIVMMITGIVVVIVVSSAIIDRKRQVSAVTVGSVSETVVYLLPVAGGRQLQRLLPLLLLWLPNNNWRR